MDSLKATVPPAEAIAALASCGSIGSDGPTEVVVGVEATASLPSLARLNPTQPLADQFRRLAIHYGHGVADSKLVPYVPGRMLADGEVVWLPASSIPLLVSIRDSLARAAELPLYEPGDKSKAPRFSVTAVTDGQALPCFFRRLNSQARLQRSRRLAAVLRGAAYDRLQEEVLLFDDQFDAVLVADHVLATSQIGVERIFGYFDELRARAATTFASVTSSLRIQGMDELRAACTSNINMMRKLASIEQRLASDQRYRDAMTMDRILKFISENPHVAHDLEGEGVAAVLVFHPDPQRRWRILKLLDDDYLRSTLTELNYESNSKSAPLT